MTALTLVVAVVVGAGLLAAVVATVATNSAMRRMAGPVVPEPREPARAAAPAGPKVLRVGGREVFLSDWSPEVLEQVRAAYFRPPANGRAHVISVDVTFTCGNAHRQLERVVLCCPSPKVARLLSDGLLRSQAEMPCADCRKPARLSGRAVSWEGPYKDWDGAM